MPKYHLPDEPRPGPLVRLVVEPMWPLLASMVGGPWIGWPWFVVNAHAVGSSTKWRQTLLAAGGLVGALGILLGIAVAEEAGVLEGRLQIRLGFLVLIGWKLAVAYVLYATQWRSVELFSYYRGVVRNGMLVVVGAALLGDKPLATLPWLVRLVLQ